MHTLICSEKYHPSTVKIDHRLYKIDLGPFPIEISKENTKKSVLQVGPSLLKCKVKNKGDLFPINHYCFIFLSQKNFDSFFLVKLIFES